MVLSREFCVQIFDHSRTVHSVQSSSTLFICIYICICVYMYLYKYIYIGGLMGYISKKVAAYGQFVLVFILDCCSFQYVHIWSK